MLYFFYEEMMKIKNHFLSFIQKSYQYVLKSLLLC